MARIVFLQRQVSQLDEPVYGRMAEQDPASCAVVYWNDYGFTRKGMDPELGVVPDLTDAGALAYPRLWIDSRVEGRAAVEGALLALEPRVVVLSDIPTLDRLRLALALRTRGIEVVFRVDKNHLSERPRNGVKLMAERRIVRHAFDALAPTSPLTNAYYAWPSDRRSIPFPYTTNERKFAPGPAVRGTKRRAVRARLRIGAGSHVFLAAAKFIARESPWELVESFARVADTHADAHLIALGDGPLLAEIRRHCRAQGLDRITFPGFVPFRELEDYFFAADTFLHLVAVEPWGVSPQDALIAGLGLVTSERVGSAQVFLDGELRRFLVPFGNCGAAAERMRELADRRDGADLFAAARARTRDYTVDACARSWIGIAA